MLTNTAVIRTKNVAAVVLPHCAFCCIVSNPQPLRWLSNFQRVALSKRTASATS
jgi:hypothetical protein